MKRLVDTKFTEEQEKFINLAEGEVWTSNIKCPNSCATTKIISTIRPTITPINISMNLLYHNQKVLSRQISGEDIAPHRFVNIMNLSENPTYSTFARCESSLIIQLE